MKSGYQPRSRWDTRPASTQRHAVQTRPLPHPEGPQAPRQGALVEINGRLGVVALFRPDMNMVEVDWTDGTGACDFWHIAEWKTLWGEK